MAQLAVMTAFACAFFFASVFLGSTVHTYSPSRASLHYSPAARGAVPDWRVQHARASQKNVARRQHGHFVQDNYQNPTSYKTLPDEVLQNHPVNYFQSLEYEANNYRPASKYPQSIETYSHNYRRQPAIHEDQRGPPQRPEYQFAQASNNYLDQSQVPHASPYEQLEQQNNHNNYIDYPPYPSQIVNSHQMSQNPNPTTVPSHEAHKQLQYLGSPSIPPNFPAYSGPYAPQFSMPGAGIQRFPSVRDITYPTYSPAQHNRNPLLHNKPHNPYFYSSSGHHHPQHPPYSKHPPSYYDPDPELTAELQQLDKEYHAEREGLSGGQSMYRLLVPLLMLGFSIPALGYMYTNMGRRREFRSGADNQSARVEYYSDLLASAISCYKYGGKCLEQKSDN